MEVKKLSDAYLGACHPQTYWRSTVELPPRHPSHPGGSLDTGGPGRAGTAGAEEHLPGWTGREEASSVGARGERGGAAGEILAEAGREEVRPRLESERWSPGSGGRLGHQAEGRKGAGLERGGEAGADRQGGRHHRRLRGNPAPGPHQAGTGQQERVEEPVAQPPPQGLGEVHVA